MEVKEIAERIGLIKAYFAERSKVIAEHLADPKYFHRLRTLLYGEESEVRKILIPCADFWILEVTERRAVLRTALPKRPNHVSFEELQQLEEKLRWLWNNVKS